jgi:hypothetical protein
LGAGGERLWVELVGQQSFNRGNEVGGAFDEFDSFLRTCRRSLIVAFLASAFGASGEGTETLVELSRGD